MCVRISFPSVSEECLKEQKERSYTALRICQLNFLLQTWPCHYNNKNPNPKSQDLRRCTRFCVLLLKWAVLKLVDGKHEALSPDSCFLETFPLSLLLAAPLPRGMFASCHFFSLQISSSLSPARNFPNTSLSLFLNLPIVRSGYFASDFPGMLLHFFKSSWMKVHVLLSPFTWQTSPGKALQTSVWPDISTHPGHTAVKNPSTNDRDSGDLGLIPELGRCPGEGNGTRLQYSCLENPTDRGVRWGPQSVGSRRVGHGWATGQAHAKVYRAWVGLQLNFMGLG